MEIPEHCVMSVIDIRRYLTKELQSINSDGELAKSMHAMRAACRKFMDTVGSNDNLVRFGAHHGHFASWHFNAAMGELRGVFGVHPALIAPAHGLDIEDELSQILPWIDRENNTYFPP